MPISTTIIWLIALVAFAILEGVTVSLVSIWFMGGALTALIVSCFTDNLWLEMGCFLVVSCLLLGVLRPLVKRYFTPAGHHLTNLDQVVGRTGVVIQPIDNMGSQGQIRVKGQIWTARSESGEPIPADTPVTVLRIEGVKVIVEPCAVNAPQNGQ